MSRTVRLTRALGAKQPGTLLTLPDGQANSLIGAGRAQPADGTAPAAAPASSEPHEREEAAPIQEPPRSGQGSTQRAWHEYATSLGLELDEDTPRDEIFDAVDASNAGSPPDEAA